MLRAAWRRATQRPERRRPLRIADAITPRYGALVLLATFGNLRWGELAGLGRRNLDLDNATVRG
jgi:integrase